MSSLECLPPVPESSTCGIGVSEDACEEKCSDPDSVCENEQGEEVVFLCPTSEDEVANVQCLLAEPQNEKLLEVDARSLKLGHEVPFGDFAYSHGCYDYLFEGYDGRMRSEILNSDPQQNGHEANFDFIDSVFEGIEDENVNKSLLIPEHLAYTGGTYTAKTSFCYEPSIDCHMQSFDSECPLQNFPTTVRPSENQGNDIRSSTVVPKTEFSAAGSDKSVPFLDEMGVSELHQVFRSTFGRDTFISDKEWLKRRILFGFGDGNDFNCDPFQLKDGLYSMEDDVDFTFSNDLGFLVREGLSELINDRSDQNMVIAEEVVMSNGDAGKVMNMSGCSEEDSLSHLDTTDKNAECTSRKRLRKPTRRYIEESSLEKSKKSDPNLRNSVCSAGRKSPSIHIQKPLYNNCSEVLPLMYKNKPSVDSGSLIGYANHARRGQPRRNMNHVGNDFCKTRKHKPHASEPKNSYSSLMSEFEPKDDVSDFSDFDDRKIGIRRKHHRLWTLSEVMKLIEGVSRYGVGRWTEIKKYLFYSSTHRTSVDLKDKWRNLLRASGAHIHGKEVQKRKKQISHSIPQAVVLRVRELAVVYPYPRQRESRCDVSAAGILTSVIEK